MSDDGYFAVDRGVWDHPMFAREKFTELQAWIWLISSSVWEPTKVRFGDAVFDLERGQCVFSLRFLATKWMWSEARVRRFLKRLSSDAAVSLKSTHLATQITICNYNDYQLSRRTDDRTVDAPIATKKNNLITKKEEAAIAAPSKTYAFESGVIKLNQKDFDQWTKAFVHLNLPAKLLAMTDWAGKQQNWFHALKSALAKQDALALAESQRAQPQPFKWNGMEGVI